MIDRVIGVAKAYTTRVERGHFPPNWMRKWDKPCAIAARNLALRLGASDAVLVRRRHRSLRRPHQWYGLSGTTKLDVDEFEEIKVCVAYESTVNAAKNFQQRPPLRLAVAPSTKPAGGNNQRLTAAPLRTCQNKRWTISASGRVDGSPIAIVSPEPAATKRLLWTRSTVPNASVTRQRNTDVRGLNLSAISSSFLKP